MDSDIAILRKGGFLTYNSGRNTEWTVVISPLSYIRHGGRMDGTHFFKVVSSGRPLLIEEITREQFELYAKIEDSNS